MVGDAAPPDGSRRLSVVVPAFNAAGTIESALRSVLAQTSAPHEVIVVDDGSRDGTLPVAGRLARRDRRIKVVSQENRGPSAARNAGIRVAGGELVSFLDADDLWMPDYVETVQALFAARPNAGIAYGDAWALDDSTKRIRRETVEAWLRPPDPPPLAADEFFRELLERNFIFVSATVPRQILLELDGFDESLPPGAEDWEMWLRIAAAGYTGAGTRRPLAVYRRRPGQVSGDLGVMLDARQDIYRRIVNRDTLPTEIRDRARALMEKFDGVPATSGPPWKEHPLARPLRRAVNWGRRERDYHRRPPKAVRAAFPDLASR
jgi:glycosyltransferase involved in cell wall biosynthesis